VVVRGEGQTQSGGGLSFRQRLERGVVQLTTGELDLATAPQLETRLGELKTSRTRVELDLSQPACIDVADARWSVCWSSWISAASSRRPNTPGNCAPTSPVGLVARKDPGRRATSNCAATQAAMYP
jgi:hypothetical protein